MILLLTNDYLKLKMLYNNDVEVLFYNNKNNNYLEKEYISKFLKKNKNQYILFDLYDLELIKSVSIRNCKKILLYNYPIVDKQVLDVVNYILPTTLKNYYNLENGLYNNKLLFPSDFNFFFNNNLNYDLVINYDYKFNNNKIIKQLIDNSIMVENSINNSNLNLINRYIDDKNIYKSLNLNNHLVFLESLSRVRHKEFFINFSNNNKSFDFKKDSYYILKRENTILYNNHNVIFDLNRQFFYRKKNIILYRIHNDNDLEFIIVFKCLYNCTYNLNQLISLASINKMIVGYNNNSLDLKEVSSLYYLYGKHNIDSYFYPLDKLYPYYTTLIDNLEKNKNEPLNWNIYVKSKFYRIYSFYYGKKNKFISLKKIETHINKNLYLFNNNKCLIVSKNIVGYGGNQKTARQLINLLSRYYDVQILSLSFSDNKNFNFLEDKYCQSIHNLDIIKLKKTNEIINHINKTDYKFIINNKHNEFMEILPLINKKNIVITHNSMDPFNKLIINNENYIDKILTINKIHSKLLVENNISENKINQYKNFIYNENKVNERTKFKKNIVFIGRISKEKNVPLLLKSWENVIKKRNDLNLFIVGDSKHNVLNEFKNLKNVIFLGRIEYKLIKLILLNVDYLILPSYTEGLPFTMLESMNLGIPCICSNINGINELIDKNNGFLFDLKGYKECKNNIDNWNVFESCDNYFNDNVISLTDKILEAYEISISKWNKFSEICHEKIKNNYNKLNTDSHNISIINSVCKIEDKK